MYKVIIQNVNQIYFSLQDHRGKRLSLTQYDIKVFEGLTLKEANSYKRYIPLGLSVLIQEDNSFITADYKVISEAIEIIPEPLEEVKSIFYTIDELNTLKKDELRELCTKVGISISKKTKAELIEDLVKYYGL